MGTFMGLLASGMGIGPALAMAFPAWGLFLASVQPLGDIFLQLANFFPLDSLIELLFS